MLVPLLFHAEGGLRCDLVSVLVGCARNSRGLGWQGQSLRGQKPRFGWFHLVRDARPAVDFRALHRRSGGWNSRGATKQQPSAEERRYRTAKPSARSPSIRGVLAAEVDRAVVSIPVRVAG